MTNEWRGVREERIEACFTVLFLEFAWSNEWKSRKFANKVTSKLAQIRINCLPNIHLELQAKGTSSVRNSEGGDLPNARRGDQYILMSQVEWGIQEVMGKL
jgi:hypothetical protein